MTEQIRWVSDCHLSPVANVERIDENEVRGYCALCGKYAWACDPAKLEPLTDYDREMMEVRTDETRYKKQEMKAIWKEQLDHYSGC